MCGVIGLASGRHRKDLGLIAAELLKTLEYRGYDSTGAAFQGDDDSIVLRKGVGAPSVMVEKLGILRLGGSIMCGQVRWATFGSVDDLNAQPHEVRCKTHIYGAHNGNVTNCDDLKGWLTSEGHQVLSDNDGEMVVHTVEHYFAAELQARKGDGTDVSHRRACMRAAILAAGGRLKGSYAAVVVDPISRTLWAIKQGSSLYFGFGRDEQGDFALASSDLSSVLKLTRVLIPMSEGEFIEYTADAYQLYTIRPRGAEALLGAVRVGDVGPGLGRGRARVHEGGVVALRDERQPLDEASPRVPEALARPADRLRRSRIHVRRRALHRRCVVVSLHHDRAARGLLCDEIDHRLRVCVVADEIADEGERVEPARTRVLEARGQRLEIGMHVREEDDSHPIHPSEACSAGESSS